MKKRQNIVNFQTYYFLLQNIANKLSHTNFKMDSDTSQINSFHTTHKDMFKPKMGDTFVPLEIKRTTQLSCIPQGDREKAELPISDYKYKYPGVDTLKNPVPRARCVHNGKKNSFGDSCLLLHVFLRRHFFFFLISDGYIVKLQVYMLV